jgi:putative sigma-54 modulation protein
METRMQTKISSKHLAITPAIEQYAEKRAAKLRRFFDRIQQIDVVIAKSRNRYTVEFITDVEHHEPFVATAEHTDMYACIDLGLDRASRQLKDHKSRLRNHKHVTPARAASGATRRKKRGKTASKKPADGTVARSGTRGKRA